jgi:virulence-associated protein VagC
MRKTRFAEISRDGRSQIIRLPEEHHFEGGRLLIRRVKHGVLLQPAFADTVSWFAELDRLNSKPFLPKRNQKPAPRREMFG